MSPRPSNREQRQNQILDAAMEVFARLGFNKARMDDIAAAAGLSKGSLYWHFESKQEIIAAVLMRMFQGYFGDLQQIVAESGPADERLRRYIAQTAASVRALRRWQPLMAEFYAVAARHESTRLFLKRYYAQYIDLLSQLIQQGIEQGVFREMDAREAALLLVSASEGVILLCALGLCEDDWGAQLETSLLHILASLEANQTDN